MVCQRRQTGAIPSSGARSSRLSWLRSSTGLQRARCESAVTSNGIDVAPGDGPKRIGGPQGPIGGVSRQQSNNHAPQPRKHQSAISEITRFELTDPGPAIIQLGYLGFAPSLGPAADRGIAPFLNI